MRKKISIMFPCYFIQSIGVSTCSSSSSSSKSSARGEQTISSTFSDKKCEEDGKTGMTDVFTRNRERLRGRDTDREKAGGIRRHEEEENLNTSQNVLPMPNAIHPFPNIYIDKRHLIHTHTLPRSTVRIHLKCVQFGTLTSSEARQYQQKTCLHLLHII